MCPTVLGIQARPGCCRFQWVREGLSDEGPSQQRPVGRKGGSLVEIWGKRQSEQHMQRP